jgi:hypothetical protein
MRMRSIMPADCARACQQLSQHMDSELSEFELVLLEAHLGRCDDCRAFGQAITGLTETLRAVPMESPSVSFQPPRIRARFDTFLTGALRAGSAAAAVAVVALTGLIAFNGSSSAIPAVDIEQARSVLDLHERQLRQLDSFGHAQTPEVPRGLAAAERTGMPAVTNSRRRQGRR